MSWLDMLRARNKCCEVRKFCQLLDADVGNIKFSGITENHKYLFCLMLNPYPCQTIVPLPAKGNKRMFFYLNQLNGPSVI